MTGVHDAGASPFPRAPRRAKGYDPAAVDAFLRGARAAFEHARDDDGEARLSAVTVRSAAFPLVRGGYEIAAVDSALARVEDAFALQERRAGIAELGAQRWVNEARDEAQVLLDRLSRPRRERFRRAGWLRFGYRIDEVDLVAEKLRRYFESAEPITADQVRGVAFRLQRRGYDEAQVDAVLDAIVEVMLAVR